MKRRKFLKSSALTVIGTSLYSKDMFAHTTEKTNLNDVKGVFYRHFGLLLDKGGPYGCYRPDVKKGATLNASVNTAITRAMMGEDFTASLAEEQRDEWIQHINSYARRNFPLQADGSYVDTEHPLNTNAYVIAALGLLGGKQKYQNLLYNDFNTAIKAEEWLDKLDWSQQWRTTHLTWGGLTYFSFSKNCPVGWTDAVINWLNNAIDEKTGWWRKGITNKDKHQPLGGSALTLTIYQQHNRDFPYPEQLIDSILSTQLLNGRWLDTKDKHVMHPLEYDVLYTLEYMMKMTPDYRKRDIEKSIKRYTNLCNEYWQNYKEKYFKSGYNWHIWFLGIFSILKRLNPESFIGGDNWTDFFSDKKFYNTDLVEVL